jgi:uncharacterized repeat protein (TIGR01451 family)
MKKIFLVFSFILCLTGIISAQITISLPEITAASEGSTVTVPVNVTNFNDIGAITLKISYDTSVLTFQGTPDPLSGNFAINASAGTLVIGWFGLTPLNTGNGTLLHLNFTYNTGTSSLAFKSGCEIANSAAVVQAVTYTNGSVLAPVVTPAKASIGNKVFVDANKNGVFDSGEAGLQWVTVELYDCAGTWKAYTTTDANGEYLFDSLEAGEYYLKFYLVDANGVYTFSTVNSGSDDAIDSDVEVLTDSTGRTACTALAAGENDLTWDCGVYLKSTTPGNLTPAPEISKTDGLVIMPDSPGTTTYTISYANSGAGSLYNAVVTDSLPEGVSFVSASAGGAETAAGSNVIVFGVGTLAAGRSGSATVKVQVISCQSEYVNKAYLSGTDSESKGYMVCAQDMNLGDTTSSGGNSGVESTGDMAELLLRREWKIRNGLTTPLVAKYRNSAISSQFALKELVPAAGPYNSEAVETTPFDIFGISNAVASYAVDYNLQTTNGSRRVAGVFSTITDAPKIYDHTKVVCDRLAGSSIDEITLLDINGYKFYGAKLRKSSGKITDYAISFSVYETSSGYYVENKWTYGEYDAPDGAASVYNFQAWAGSYESAAELVKEIISNISARGTVTYMNTEQSEPEVFIKSTRYTHDGYVHLTMVNNTTSVKQLTVKSYIRFSQGDELIPGTSGYAVEAGESEIEINTGIVANAQVKITGVNGFMDEIYVSGGTFANVTGSKSTVSEFVTSGYPAQNAGAYPEGTVLLAGGAYVAGTLNDWVTVVRSLSTDGSAYDLSGFGDVSFTAKGSGVLTVILDLTSVTNYNYFARNITLTEQETEYTLDFSDFSQLYGSDAGFDASKIYAAGFIYNTDNNAAGSNFNFEVKNIRFNPSNTTSVETGGSRPAEFSLAQNFPNPFNPSTVIEFSVAAKEKVSLKVFDMLGQEVAELVNEELEPGNYHAAFNAVNLSSGVYFYRLQGSSVNLVKKMTFTK